ncbi:MULTISPECIES: winged helix-turn-helix domain-containing protein [unclassified Luteococcus]|uniref:winged helix-turn-helix domain-containing protein n=1 Tax=unclassified Luteococcus TaxID=2639923 RepID=UPI00313DE192
MRDISLSQARRIALAAQGFGRPRPERTITMRDVQAQIDRLAQFQIDSINVVARAHEFPLYSRLGPYDTNLLTRACGRAPRRLFEYWGHAASLIDVNLQPALRFRMAHAQQEAWGGIVRVSQEHPGLVEFVRDEVRTRGPITARQIERDEQRDRRNWGWNWSATKTALEWLFWCGEITSASRNQAFERRYDLPERILPSAVVTRATPSIDDSHVILVRRAARALGIASEGCLADYFRLGRARTRTAVATLESMGELEQVTVQGWPARTWLWTGDGHPRIPRTITARALISPFDSLIFERRRALALFGLDYKIEIYVPEAKRRYGYYVYPFLLGERFAARVDLKADRAAGMLRVRAAWLEPGTGLAPEFIASELLTELRTLAAWLGLARIDVEPRGDLAEVIPITP